MLNEERVILMTRMAAFEQHEGKKNNAINSYFRSDYVGYEVLKSIISATIVYLILVAAYVMYHFSDVLLVYDYLPGQNYRTFLRTNPANHHQPGLFQDSGMFEA